MDPAAHGRAHAPITRLGSAPSRAADGVRRKPSYGSDGIGTATLGFLDQSQILSLQATAGNAAVTSLLTGPGFIQRQPAGGTPGVRSARQQILDKLHADSNAAALQIKEILVGNSYLGSGNQAEIMSIIRPWASIPGAPTSSMTGMDWLIAGLRHYTYQVGWVVNQTTSAFDELHRRMDKKNVDEFQAMIQQSGNQFKNDKPIELAKFEVSREDIIRGVKAGLGLAAAIGTGGASVLYDVGQWLLDDVPRIWSQVKAVLGLIDSIRGFRSAGVGSKFSEAGLGTLAVEGLFGELGGLPVMGGKEPPKADESGEASGLTKALMMIARGISVVKGAYNKIATRVNGIIHIIDIHEEPWLPEVAAIYAGIVKATELVKDPFSAFKMLAEKAQEKIGGFFDKISGHLSEVVNGVTEKLGMIIEPVRLMEHVADRLVSTLLNFIVTHPPSALLKTVFEVVQMAAGKDLIDLIREQVRPIGDKIIKRIANSKFVKTVVKPLEEPVHKISDAIGHVMQKGMEAVKGVQSKVAAFLNPDKLKELTGLGSSFKPPVPIAEAPAPPTDFLGAVKEGLHARLMMIGGPRLLALAKSGTKFLWEKAKAGAKSIFGAIKGAIFGSKKQFEAGGQHHELWAEQTEEGPTLMMASKKTTVQEKAKEYEQNKNAKRAEAKLTELRELVDQAKKLNADIDKADVPSEDDKKQAEKAKKQLREIGEKLEPIEAATVAVVKELEGLLVGAQRNDVYEQDAKGRPILAATTLKETKGGRNKGEETDVSRPLTQLMEYLQQPAKDEKGRKLPGGTWQAGEAGEYGKKERPTFDAAHLIPDDFGGDPTRKNLVPVEARVNKSFMGTDEAAIRSAVKDKGANYYMVATCEYNDIPPEFAKQFTIEDRSGVNPKSKYKPRTRVRFNLAALDRVPDSVKVKVVDKDDNDKVIHEHSYPTGGPLIDWLGMTRSELEKLEGDAVEQILDPEARDEIIEHAKASTDWKPNPAKS